MEQHTIGTGRFGRKRRRHRSDNGPRTKKRRKRFPVRAAAEMSDGLDTLVAQRKTLVGDYRSLLIGLVDVFGDGFLLADDDLVE